MAAPGGEETSKPLGLVRVFAAAALFFVLSACSPSQNKQGNEGGSAATPSASSSASSSASAASTPRSEPASAQPSATASATEGEGDAVDIGSITIESVDGANNGAPIAVDLVIVYDAALIPQLEAQSSEAWFKGKAAMAASAGTNLSIMSWTIAPGDEVPETEIDTRPGVLAAFVFANYAVKGDHRLRIDGSGALTVTLGASEPSFEVEQ